MDKLDNRAAPGDGFLSLQVLFFLRFIQLGSTVLTGFIASYFVWWHDRLHDKVPLGLLVVICTVRCPTSLILSLKLFPGLRFKPSNFIYCHTAPLWRPSIFGISSWRTNSGALADHNIQCSIAFLESYISSAYALSKRDRYPNYRFLLKTTVPSAAAMSWGYWSLRQVPFVREWCEGDNWFRPVAMYNANAGVEEHHCALTCDIIVTGAIALYVSIFYLFVSWYFCGG
jgi:hypothetical protein